MATEWKIKMKKFFKIFAICWLAVLALFNVITFVTPNEINGECKFDAVFWIAYSFITLSFIAQLVCTYFVSKTDSLKKTFYSIPLLHVSIASIALMFIAGTVSVAVIQIPSWIGIILCAVVFAFNIIAYAKATVVIDVVSGVDSKINAKTMFTKLLIADAESLLARAEGEEMSKVAKSVYEAIRYSDPMSDSALSDVENKITAEFAAFSKNVTSGELDGATASAKELLALINERNVKCKILK